MSAPTPTVSVVMPMRNAEAFVQEAVRSVLDQRTGHPFEIIIVNDGSTDASRARVEAIGDPRVRVLEGGGNGEARAVNLALDAARGEFVMRCDADDLWPADRMEWQVAWLREHPEYGAVCGAMWTTDEKGKVRVPLTAAGGGREITADLLNGDTVTSLCTFAARREHLARTGGCRPYFVMAPDLDLQCRLAEVCRVWFEPRLCYVYRLHGASVTHATGNARRVFFSEQSKRFAVQRRQTGTDDLQRGVAAQPPAHHGGTNSERRQLSGQLVGAAWRAHSEGRRREAVAYGLRALRCTPSLETARQVLLLALRPGRRRDPA